jgi:hypothetical protein
MRVLALSSLVLFVVSLSACAPRINERGQKIDKHGRTAETAAGYADAVKNRRLKPGMHKGEVRDVMQSKPELTNYQKHNNKQYLVWQYRSRSLDIYFDDDGYLMFWRAPY